MPVIGFGVPIHESVEGHTYIRTALLWAGWRDFFADDVRLKIYTPRGSDVSENRNRIVKELLLDGETGPDGVVIPGQDAPVSHLTTRAADVIVWNDSDCFVNLREYARLVDTLMAQPEDVAAVAYAFPIQTDDEQPRPNIGGTGTIQFNAARPGMPAQPVQLFDVEWTGFGVVATRAAVFRAMGAGPWFTFKSGDGGRGEDIGWCRDVRALGFRILVDAGVLGSHCYRAPHRLDDFYAQNHRDAQPQMED